MNELCLLESLISEAPTNYNYIKAFDNAILYISEILTNPKILKNFTIDDIICHYNDNYKMLSDAFFITEMIDIYHDCYNLLLVNENELTTIEYNDQDLEYNGFVKSTFVIHEHDSKKAPLHWDLRFKTEFQTSAYSFVLLKHKMPNNDEKILVKRQSMHPPIWVDLDHTTIGNGEYGEGSITTVDRGDLYYKINKESFTIYMKGSKYRGAYHLININYNNYLMFKAINSILPTKEERNSEWIEYACKFVEYIKSQIQKKYNIRLDVTVDINKIISKADYEHILANNNNSNIHTIYIQSLQYCIDLKNSEKIKDIIHKDCKINSIEDISRLFILRDFIAPLFTLELKARLGNDIIEKIYDEIYEKTFYNDLELEHIKINQYNLYKNMWFQRMFSDIFMGHKFYGQFDFERYLIKKVNNK